jgi:sterol desaturase/sphingolipid hydroxylase (fatty acid hydroxylase superfamily)
MPELDLQTLSVVKTVLVVVGLTLLWSWESWWPLFTGRTQRVRHAARNLGLGAVNTVVLTLTCAVATAWVAGWTWQNRIGLLTHVQPTWLAVVLALVFLDAWMYAWHRLNHSVPLLWRFHRTHHSDTELDVTSALRFHLGEHVFGSVLRIGWVVVIGLKVEWILLYELVLLPVILFHHSNIALGERWDRLLRWLIVTPNMHRVHHSRWRVETNSNYSSVLSIWDRLFRTFRLRSDPRTIRYGLDEFADPHWQTWAGLWQTPFVTPDQPAEEPPELAQPIERPRREYVESGV